MANGTKAVNARLTGVTETAGAETGIPKAQRGERIDGNNVKLLAHEAQICLNWNLN